MHTGLGDNIIVNLHPRQMRAALVPILNRRLTKRRIADNQVKYIIGKRSILKAGRREDIRFGIQQSGDIPGHSVDLRGVPLRRRSDIQRLKSKEITHPDRRLQRTAALKAEKPYHAPHSVHDRL